MVKLVYTEVLEWNEHREQECSFIVFLRRFQNFKYRNIFLFCFACEAKKNEQSKSIFIKISFCLGLFNKVLALLKYKNFSQLCVVENTHLFQFEFKILKCRM